MREEDVKKNVREGYGRIATKGKSCCSPVTSCCREEGKAFDISRRIGYRDDEILSVPEGANLGLGCGNPTAMASLKKGETVLDLGSGAGFDCFLAAKNVGLEGKVIGVDMTPEMIDKARENARKGNYGNVEFRLGEIENLPVADNSVNVIISNCVINLAPDKKKVFSEAFRVLRAGGRIMVSDIVLLKELPASMMNSVESYVGCISGAIKKDEYIRTIKSAGFKDVRVVDETRFPMELMANDPTAKAIIEGLNIPEEELKSIAESVVSIRVQASK